MKTRLQPIGNIWTKFPRFVRDLAVSCGKQVRLEMEGKETELDKSLLEAIKDPLTHIVRNSVDHGIEMPDKRVARGKVVQRHVLYLGEINSSQQEAWRKTIEIFEEGQVKPETWKIESPCDTERFCKLLDR